MTEEQPDQESAGDRSEGEEAGKGAREALEDRLKQGIGMLGAMRDAIEDTIREARERGDLSPDRAKEVMRSALNKAQEKAGEAKDALDLVKQKELDALRERVDDIPLLANHLLARIRLETGQDVRRISEEAMERLTEYAWPGNVRELENALTRAAIVARGPVIGAEHLRLEVEDGAMPRPAPASGASELLDGVVEAHVRKVLEAHDGNKTETARALGISRSRLTRLIERFGL